MRLFVAAWPDDSILQRLAVLELAPTEPLGLVKSGQWHITLRFLGEVDAGLVPALVHALGTAAGKLPDSIHCEMGPGTDWLGDRVLQIPVAGLEEGAGVVRDSTLPIVPDPNHREPQFTGHLTVARSKRRRPSESARAALAGIPFAGSLEVDAIDLVASHLSTEGVRYKTLARVPLGR